MVNFEIPQSWLPTPPHTPKKTPARLRFYGLLTLLPVRSRRLTQLLASALTAQNNTTTFPVNHRSTQQQPLWIGTLVCCGVLYSILEDTLLGYWLPRQPQYNIVLLKIYGGHYLSAVLPSRCKSVGLRLLA